MLFNYVYILYCVNICAWYFFFLDAVVYVFVHIVIYTSYHEVACDYFVVTYFSILFCSPVT